MNVLRTFVDANLDQQFLFTLNRFSTSYLPQNSTKRKLLLSIVLGCSGGSLLILYKIFKRKYSLSTSKKDELVLIPKKTTRLKVQVDRIFFQRLLKIIKIIIPSISSKEFLHLIVLTLFLLVRTILSIQIADVTGLNAQYLVQKRWKDTIKGVILFGAIGIPASCVNSGLKYETAILSLLFRKRLSEKINSEYINGINFYKASHLGGENRIDNADQRITADIEKFCDSLSILYTTIFKALLDVVLFTHKLSGIMGMRGPLILYGYYIISGALKRYLMPTFGKLTARESELEGDYRTAHQRLIFNAEEIAFYDGSKKERLIIGRLFQEIYLYSKNVQWMKALVGVFDSFLVKYGTSITGYGLLALPIYFPSSSSSSSSSSLVSDVDRVSELTKAYVRNRQLLISLGTAVAQLVVLSNKVASLAGLTARVSELLEMIRQLDRVGTRPFVIREEPSDLRSEISSIAQEQPSLQQSLLHPQHQLYWEEQKRWMEEWRIRGEEIRRQRASLAATSNLSSPILSSSSSKMNGSTHESLIIEGKFIKFENVSIVSPDGKLLVEDLTFQVRLQQNVMVTGPNGSGKSSLFRVLGELWPLHCGVIVKPRKEELLFVPQKPYLVLGTLRDQIIYPHSLDDMRRLNISDEDLACLLNIVDPARVILGSWKFDEVKDWFNAFSGGQKQRIAMARLFYHRPLYAILDECTSAVSDEVEGKIYEACKQFGITLFTVSHRVQLKRYHDYMLRLDGAGHWEFSSIDHSSDETEHIQ